EEKIPLQKAAAMDVMAELMQRRLVFVPGERDMILLKHEFVAEYPADGRQEEIVATMVDYGQPGGDSAMARTVSLPAAIAVRCILEGRLAQTGVHRPTLPELYDPILEELKTLAIEVKESVREL
ncbi:MAG: saccharopine dehydrogenase, partial [Deltaproteobacteria bacterium]|nr:saccharopine dehydrogenase [Deltaproteobacteria bacterium]